MTESLKQKWWPLLRWPLAVGLLSWLILPNLQVLQDLVQQGVRWRWLSLAFALRALSLLLTGVRWKVLLQGQSVSPPPVRLAQIVGIGYVSNFFLPGTIGGDVVKAGLIAAETPEARKRAIATVPLDRALGLLAFVTLGGAIGSLRWDAIPSQRLQAVVLVMLGISGVGLASLLAAFLFSVKKNPGPLAANQGHTSLIQTLRGEIRKVLAVLRRSRQTVVVALLIGLAGHLSLCSAAYSCLRAFPAADFPVAWIDNLWVVPGAEVPAAFLSLPGGLGAREGALSYFYGEFATQPSEVQSLRGVGVLVGCCFSLVSIGLALVVGATLLVLGQTLPSASKRYSETVG